MTVLKIVISTWGILIACLVQGYGILCSVYGVDDMFQRIIIAVFIAIPFLYIIMFSFDILNTVPTTIFMINIYTGLVNWLALVNIEKGFSRSIVDAILLFNMGGINTQNYETPLGMAWILCTSIVGVLFWVNLMYTLVKIPPVQQVVPVFPMGSMSVNQPSGRVLAAPARHRWSAQHKKKE